MLFHAIPEMNESSHQNVKLLHLQTVLREQLEDITTLGTLAEYLGSFQQIGLDVRDSQTYLNKVEAITLQQKNRFKNIDALINENILAVKKKKTTDQTVLLYGKEVRKMESGLRTLKLFICDVVKMLSPSSIESNRVKDRLSYFNKRAMSLEVEIKTLQLQLNQF